MIIFESIEISNNMFDYIMQMFKSKCEYYHSKSQVLSELELFQLFLMNSNGSLPKSDITDDMVKSFIKKYSILFEKKLPIFSDDQIKYNKYVSNFDIKNSIGFPIIYSGSDILFSDNFENFNNSRKIEYYNSTYSEVMETYIINARIKHNLNYKNSDISKNLAITTWNQIESIVDKSNKTVINALKTYFVENKTLLTMYY
jgi:hypothetical protein